MKNSLQVITAIIAIAGLGLTAGIFWFTHLRRVQVAIEPENEIRLRQFPGQTGWSLRFQITISGPESKWASVKFTRTNFTAPDSHVYGLLPMSHLSNVGIRQQNVSRNVPIEIKGGESRSVIIGYQSSEMQTWQQGEYHIRFVAFDSKERSVPIKPKRFVVDGRLFENLKNPQNDQMVSLLPETETTH